MAAEVPAIGAPDVLAEVGRLLDGDQQLRDELARQDVGRDAAMVAARQVLQEPRFAAEALLRELMAAERAERAMRSADDPWYINALIAIAVTAILGFIGLFVIGLAKWTGHWLRLPIWPFVTVPALLLGGSGVALGALSQGDEEERTSQTVAAESLRSRFEEQLRSLVVLPAIERATKIWLTAPSADRVVVTDGPGLASRVEADSRIETESYRQVLTALSRSGGAAIGLAGTRGAGKSEMLRWFCADPAEPASIQTGGTLGVIIPAPVAYEPEQFLRVLVRRLAEAVPGYDAKLVGRIRPFPRLWQQAGALIALALAASGILLLLTQPRGGALADAVQLLSFAAVLIVVLVIARAISAERAMRLVRTVLMLIAGPPDRLRDGASPARQEPTERRRSLARTATSVVERILYTQTRTMSMQASASWHGVGVQNGTGVSLGQLPLTEADLVVELTDFIKQLSSGGYTVRIGIDELDKLDDADAKNFLTGLKVLFAIRDCSFLLTISEDASAQFARRGMAIRDMFDSSLDSVTVVGALTYQEARRVVRARSTAADSDYISDTQVLLCFLLSGGLPRELLRFCRQLGEVNVGLGGRQTLAEVATGLLRSERSARITAVELELRGRDEPAGGAFIAELEKVAATAGGPELMAELAEFLRSDPEFADIARAPELVQMQRLRATQVASRRDWIRDTRRQLMSYLFFARTVAEAMAGLEALGNGEQLQEAADLATFEILADAQRRLELDAAAGWRRVAEARRELDLAPASPADAVADTTGQGPHPHPPSAVAEAAAGVLAVGGEAVPTDMPATDSDARQSVPEPG